MPHANCFSSALSHRRALRFFAAGASAAYRDWDSAFCDSFWETFCDTSPTRPCATTPQRPTPPNPNESAAACVSCWNCVTASPRVRRFTPRGGGFWNGSGLFAAGSKKVVFVFETFRTLKSTAALWNFWKRRSDPLVFPVLPEFVSMSVPSVFGFELPIAVAPTPARNSTASAVAGESSSFWNETFFPARGTGVGASSSFGLVGTCTSTSSDGKSWTVLESTVIAPPVVVTAWWASGVVVVVAANAANAGA
mmetsp:Transcript_8197/g.27248  ORF Transcript_8197/g.27248 Transcript_8197/m.27248 type:complete len:251 (+) Transcript_8197:1087-1839(+)